MLDKLKLDEIDEALDDSELDCDIDELVEAEDVAEEDIVDVNEIESMVALLVEAIEVDDAILEVSIVADTEPDAGLLEVENEAELEEVWRKERKGKHMVTAKAKMGTPDLVVRERMRGARPSRDKA